jgi:hypothetical protein
MSWPEQREQINEILKNLAGNPQLLNQLGFGMASNIGYIQDYLMAIPDWQIPNQEALIKLHNEIRELLKGEPTPQPSQAVPGQTVMIPSIPVDEFDPHDFVAEALEEWFQSENAQEIRQSNPNGFDNVLAFWKAHKGFTVPPPPPGGGPGGPPAPGPGPAAGPGGPPPPPGGPPPGGVPKLMPPAGGTAPVGAK